MAFDTKELPHAPTAGAAHVLGPVSPGGLSFTSPRRLIKFETRARQGRGATPPVFTDGGERAAYRRALQIGPEADHVVSSSSLVFRSADHSRTYSLSRSSPARRRAAATSNGRADEPPLTTKRKGANRG